LGRFVILSPTCSVEAYQARTKPQGSLKNGVSEMSIYVPPEDQQEQHIEWMRMALEMVRTLSDLYQN
jgi:hypothetical protein